MWPLWALPAALIVMLLMFSNTLSIWHFILLLVFGNVIFIPTYVAGRRGHRNAIAIFVLNLVVFLMVLLSIALAIAIHFDGTLATVLSLMSALEFLGWVAALVWSFLAKGKPNGID
ncbi:hypothetical protein UP10_12770 [Bradyrhizobium sp. LTSPM299]|nr:hypothetical protein UP10_12770 [Bradyrhizobium sp. LTSPM299]